MAVRIPDTATASLWVATSALPNTKPWGLASSPDGSTLYVGMVGTTGTSSIVAVDTTTKAATTIVSGRSYVRHGLTVNPATGILYWSEGANTGAQEPPQNESVYAWNAGTITTQFSGSNFWGLEYDPDLGRLFSIFYPNWGARLRSHLLNGVQQSHTRVHADEYKQHRPIAVTATYVLAGDADEAGLDVWTKASLSNASDTVGMLRRRSMIEEPTGIHAVSDTEVYILAQRGDFWRYDPSTDTLTGLNGLPGNGEGYGDLHITSKGRAFATCGGWNASRGNIGPLDQARGTDAGIYEITTNPMPVATRRPMVGMVGWL